MPWSFFGYQKSPHTGVDPRALVKLEMTVRSFDRMTREADKKQRAMRLRAEKAMERGERSMARVYLESSVNNEASKERYARMACKVAAIKRDVQYHAMAGTMTEDLREIVQHVADVVSPYGTVQNVTDMEAIFQDVTVATNEVDDALGAMSTTVQAKGIKSNIDSKMDEMEAAQMFGGVSLDLPEIDKSGEIVKN